MSAESQIQHAQAATYALLDGQAPGLDESCEVIFAATDNLIGSLLLGRIWGAPEFPKRTETEGLTWRSRLVGKQHGGCPQPRGSPKMAFVRLSYDLLVLC